MSIIVVANQKGGVGKTAITVNLAHGLIRETGCKLLVVDADPAQGTIRHFHRRQADDTPYPLSGNANTDIHKRLPGLMKAGGFEHAIVDCPAGVSNITRCALLIADIVIVPVQPSFCDFDAAEGLMLLLKEVCSDRPEMQIRIVITRAGNNGYSKDSRSAAAQFFELEGLDVKVLRQVIAERMDIKHCYTEGKTIFEYKLGGDSATQFASLSEEVAACLNQPVAA